MSFPFDPKQGLVIVRAELWGPAGSAVLRSALDNLGARFPKRAYPRAVSRSRSTSRTGGCPNSRLYSRLNCEASS
jgi:hypothetical protein